MQTNTTSKTTLSLRLKLMIPIMVLITIIFILSYYGIQHYLKTTINGIMKEEINSVINVTTACLDEDKLQALTESNVQYDESAGWPTGMTDARYWELQSCLNEIDTYNPRAELFTYYVIDKNTLAYGLDQYATVQPESSYPFRSSFTAEADTDFDKLLLGLKDLYYYDELKYFEEDNVYYFGASAPLKNSKNEVIGGLTVYLDANLMTESLNNLSNILYIIFAVIYLVVAGLILLITRSATSQLSALKTASTRVAEGDYTPISLKPQTIGDEVSALTSLFNIMLEKVRGREETLNNQLQELEIIIDVKKRDEDVKAIKDSEFFQDLKSRAAELRRQKQNRE